MKLTAHLHLMPRLKMCTIYPHASHTPSVFTQFESKLSDFHVGRASCIELRNAYRIIVGKPEGNSPLGRPRRKWEGNNEMGFQETGCEVVDWIHLAQDRDKWQALLNMVMNLRVPKEAGDFLTSRMTISFSRRTLLHEIN
jgi:hypothetical protein